jgi:hypothetical protein
LEAKRWCVAKVRRGSFPLLCSITSVATSLVQFETRAQLGSREAFPQLATGQLAHIQNTTGYYVSLSYRINFNH